MHVPRGQQIRVRAGAREGWARQRTRRKLLPAPPRHANSSCPVLRFRVVQVNTQAVNESLRRQECVGRPWVDDGLHTPLDSSVAHENSDEHLAETVQWHGVLSSASVFLATAAPASWRFDRLVDRQRSSLTTVSCRLGMTKSITEIKNNFSQTSWDTYAWCDPLPCSGSNALMSWHGKTARRCRSATFLARPTSRCAPTTRNLKLPRHEGLVSSRCGQTEWLHHLSLNIGLAVFVHVRHLWVNQEPISLFLFYPITKEHWKF